MEREAAHSKPRSPVRRVLSWLLPAIIAAALLIGVLPAIADFSEVWQKVSGLSTAEVVLLFLLAAWNILTYQFVIMSALPGLPLWQAFLVGQISTAISNTVPAGSAVGIGVTYSMFTRLGHSAASVGIAAALTGLWNTFVKLGLPIMALAILTFGGNPNAAMIGAALGGLAILTVAVAILGVVVASERLAAAAGFRLGSAATAVARPFGRGPFLDWEERLCGFRERTADVLTGRWLWLTGSSLLSHLSLFVMLLASLRLMGVEAEDVSWPEVLAAFALVRLVTALPITPGGIGLVEVGMTGALVLAGGQESAVVAGVLVYRALSYAIQIPLGAVCWVGWRIAASSQSRRDVGSSQEADKLAS
jgi:putative heme transporter